MFKRWLRSRLDKSSPDLEQTAESDDRSRGALVRKGRLVTLRTHVPANRTAFQRWYADPEIAGLLRHDLEPLSATQSRGYFDTFILPSSARGLCFAIHERKTKRLIGTTALTDRTRSGNGESALFRIVIGEKERWGHGYGTEATRLVAEEAFDSLGLAEVRLEVFRHNERAINAYRRVGFEVTGEHVEWVPRRKIDLHVIEMRLSVDRFRSVTGGESSGSAHSKIESRVERKQRRIERVAARQSRRARDGRPHRNAERSERRAARARPRRSDTD